MKILIIGSKGFIGTHTLKYFRGVEYDAYGCDVVVEYDDARYFQVDATNSSYDDIFTTHQFEACINCSGAASVPDSFAHPQRDFHLNSNNVFNLLEAIRKHNPSCKFINLSSAAVYGDPEHLPVSESSPSHPLSPYGWHKFYSEMICQEFVNFYNLKACSVRIFSAFGPGLRKQLFWDLYKKSKSDGNISLFGTGKESRDFIFIDDIVEGIHVVLRKGIFDGRNYNLASGIETTIQEASHEFYRGLEYKGKIEFQMNGRPGDPINWKADIQAIQALGFYPKVSFPEGVRNYIRWLHENA